MEYAVYNTARKAQILQNVSPEINKAVFVFYG